MHDPSDRLPHILLIVANGIKMEVSFMPNLNLTLMTLFCLVLVFLNIPKAILRSVIIFIIVMIVFCCFALIMMI